MMLHLSRLQAQHELRFSDKLGEAPLNYIEELVYIATGDRNKAREEKMKAYKARLIRGLDGWNGDGRL